MNEKDKSQARVELQRDGKVDIYIQAIIGTVLLSVFATEALHLFGHHVIMPFDWAILAFSLIVGLYLVYRAYQQFNEKHHAFTATLLKSKVA